MGITEEVSSSPNLGVQVLGELTVRVGGEVRELPRSRKTRALFAYLALTGREHRREHLCNLFWDVTDDPRAALRWSLSKLRKVIEEGASTCLLASRTHVRVELASGTLDVHALRSAARAGLESHGTEELEELAGICRGELLEGMFLPEFDAFEAWLEAERAEARAQQSQLRRLLVTRLAVDPERALPHARAWLARSGEREALEWVERLSSALGGAAAEAHAAPGRESPRGSTARSSSRPVLGPATAPSPPQRPLVGRDRELSRLWLIAEEAMSQRTGRVVLLLGEPGMGKTRLLEELRYRAGGLSPCVLEGTFHEAERNRPLAPFLDAIREAFSGWQVPGAEAGAPDREQLFEVLAGAVRRGADEQGLGLLLLDDAHLCDPSSCELLHYVVRTAARSPLLTVATCRPAELDDNGELSRALVALRRRQLVEEIRLQPLGPEALRILVASEAPHGPLDRLMTESAGNPLLALEMARASSEPGEVPRTLTDLVLARVASLPPSTQNLVRWGAIFERGFVATLQAACTVDVPDFITALETATRYGLMRYERGSDAKGSFAMAHALIQRVVYESISPMRRAAMHGAAAEILGRGQQDVDRTSVIAHHATRADRPDLAARALIDGAAACAKLGAVREAAELADRAMASLDLVASADATQALELELGALLLLAQVRRPDEPARFVARLTTLGLSALDQGRAEDARAAFHAASSLRWEAGAGREGYGLARQAWQASRTGDVLQRIRASSFMALCLVLMEKQLPDALALVHEAEALAKVDRGSAESAELALARALLHLHAGRIEDARRDAADARMLAQLAHDALQEASALQLLVQLEHMAGKPSETVAAADALAELAGRIREGGEAQVAAAALALSKGDLPNTRGELDLALRRLRALDDKRRLAWVANRWAMREREAGEVERARQLAAAAFDAAHAVEAASEAAIAACGLMAAAAQMSDDARYAEAEQSLAELESNGTLSFEALRIIEQVTLGPETLREPTMKGIV